MMRTTIALICFTTFTGCALEDTDEVPAPEGSLAEESGQLARLGSDSRHCVIPVRAAPVDGKVDELPVAGSPQCFPTFSRAIDFATNSRVRLPNNATPDDLDESTVSDFALAAPFVVGIEYQHADFRGATLTYTSYVTCLGSPLQASSIPSGWHDIISSARAYSYCNHAYHYEDSDFGGAVVDCGAACSYVGDAMNDRTSSLYWTY